MTKKFLKKDDLNDSVAIIMGTRPGIIKMGPIVKECTGLGIDNFIIHTGQHYSENMDNTFFSELELPEPVARVDSTRNYSTHGEQTSEMIVGVERILLDLKPKIVLVCGDANTNLAAGLAARKLGIIVGHVESGLRSHDWSMPEEHNRIILDHISELLFAPTEESCNNLVMDNVRGEIYLTGNTIVDAVLDGIDIAERKGFSIEPHGLESCNYVLCTSHREENVDFPERLKDIVTGIARTTRATGLAALFPAHPRTQKRLREFGLIDSLLKNNSIKVIEPVGYLEFSLFIKNAAVILTDSGGIQEEACILHTPCVTMRENTERPDTLKVGSNTLAGTSPNNIMNAAIHMMGIRREWQIPFGDGKAAYRIAHIAHNILKKGFTLKDVTTPRVSFSEIFKMWNIVK